MDTRQKHITMTSCFNAAVRLTVAGVAKPETADWEAEVVEQAKVLYQLLATEMEALEFNTVGSVSPASVPAGVPGVAPSPPAPAAVPDTTPFVSPAPAPAAPAAGEQLYNDAYWDLTNNSCPTCATVGRVGMVIQSSSDKWNGPEFMCSLNKSEKGNDGKYHQVGFCDWQDWGKNSTK